MTDRILTPLLAIGLAFLVWMYTRSRDQDVLDNYQIPVELQIAPAQAEHYDLEVGGDGHVPVSFAGPPSRIRELRGLLQHGDIRLQRTVSVPEEHQAEARYVDYVRLDPATMTLPAGVRAVIAENQNRIQVTFRRIIEKRMTVRLNHTGGDRLDQVVMEPSTVTVRGPKEILDREDSIPTQLYMVPNPAATTQPIVKETPEQVPLVKELGGRSIQVNPRTIAVRFTLRPRQKVHELTEVPVHFLCPSSFPYRPQFTSDRAGRITLRVQGPATEERPSVIAFVDLTTRMFGAGLHAEEPIQVQLPPGYQLAQEPPRLSSFKLVAVEAPSKPPETVLQP